MKFNGQRLRTLRKSRNLTMKDIEEKTGLLQGAISQMENNIKNPRSKTVDILAELFNVNPIYFYMDEGGLPSELLPNMSEDLKEFIMNERNLPYIEMIHRAVASGVPSEALEKTIDALILSTGNVKQVE